MYNAKLAETAYNAYRKRTGGKSAINGEPLIDFGQQSNLVRDAWDEAAEAVRKELEKPQQKQPGL